MANDRKLPTINIKGKEYVTVDARVQAFWDDHPDGSIVTELLSDDGTRCVFKATAIIGGEVLATGHAFEEKGASNVNKTSYLENCETSAVGRALGFMGIGSAGSIASADEVQHAIAQQGAQSAYNAAKQRLWKAIQAYARAQGREPESVLNDATQRRDWRDDAETFERIAEEFEGAL